MKSKKHIFPSLIGCKVTSLNTKFVSDTSIWQNNALKVSTDTALCYKPFGMHIDEESMCYLLVLNNS